MYYNRIEHYKYGRLHYRMELRNWCVTFYSPEQNREKGPLCEIVLLDYAVEAWGKSPEEAEWNLLRILDGYAKRDEPLPIEKRKALWKELWFALRIRMLTRQLRKKGCANQVGPRT